MEDDTHYSRCRLFTCRLPPSYLLLLPSLAVPDANKDTHRETHKHTEFAQDIYINTRCHYNNRKEQNLPESKVV